jgi:hypothetical protein
MADETRKLLKLFGLNTRWLETTQHIVAAQNALLSTCAEAAAKVK